MTYDDLLKEAMNAFKNPSTRLSKNLSMHRNRYMLRNKDKITDLTEAQKNLNNQEAMKYNTGGIMSLLQPLKSGLAPMVQEEGVAKLDQFINEISQMATDRFGEYQSGQTQQPVQQPMMPRPMMPLGVLGRPPMGKGGLPSQYPQRVPRMPTGGLNSDPLGLASTPAMLTGLGSYLTGAR